MRGLDTKFVSELSNGGSVSVFNKSIQDMKYKISISDSEVLICGEGIFVLTGSRLVHAAEKIIPGAKVSLEIELVSRFPTPIKCERISVSLQCKVRIPVVQTNMFRPFSIITPSNGQMLKNVIP